MWIFIGDIDLLSSGNQIAQLISVYHAQDNVYNITIPQLSHTQFIVAITLIVM